MASSSLLPFIFACLVIQCTSVCAERKHYGVVVDRDGFHRVVELDKAVEGPVLREGDNPLVTGWFNSASYATTGWMELYISGQVTDQINSSSLAYSAGFIEGVLTAPQISMHWQNTYAGYCNTSSEYCDKLIEFLDKNTIWIKEQINKNKGDMYWYQVSLFYEQLAGLIDGYAASKQQPNISEFGFMLLQYAGDLEVLEAVLGGGSSNGVFGSGSCSALVKLAPNNADLFFTHDTWDVFQSMLRIYKRYDLPFSLTPSQQTAVPAANQSFSSYPGILMSGDDFYMLSSGLATMETTNGIMNSDLWQYVTPESVMEGVRNIVANRLALTAEEWCQIFQVYNSGTYNNQWMVVDYNKFQPRSPHLAAGTFYVLEQIPNKVEYQDMSAYLQQEKYWGSYNIPYFKDIYEASGFPAAAAKYGQWFTHDGTPRALIYARDQSKAVDLDSVIKLMRYNDFQHDPLSACNCTPPYSGENGISARCDLNPANGTYPFGALGHRCHGGTDNKVVNYELFKDFTVVATSGPTHQELPPFKWSDTEWARPKGHPDEFNFQPVYINFNYH